MKIAVQMDHIAAIKILGDSTFGMMLEAQERGHTLFHYTPNDIFMRDGKVYAHIQSVKVKDEQGKHFELGEMKTHDLSEFDVVLLRQDPPFDMAYITTTHLLERIHPKTLVVNDPFHVRNAPEKILVTEFPDLMPPTLITRSVDDMRAFKDEFKDIIMKPIYGNGGASIFHVKENDDNFKPICEMFLSSSLEPIMLQPFLPEVKNGDKRIILLDGEAKAGLNRVPQLGEIRSNLVRGGLGELSPLTKREKHICERIGETLKKRGLIFVGIDVIGDYITEINVTSPTGLRAIMRLGGENLFTPLWEIIERKCGII